MEIYNLRNEARRSPRESACLNESEHICSILRHTPSNGMGVCVEPMMIWRRQHYVAGMRDMPHEHTGKEGRHAVKAVQEKRGETACIVFLNSGPKAKRIMRQVPALPLRNNLMHIR